MGKKGRTPQTPTERLASVRQLIRDGLSIARNGVPPALIWAEELWGETDFISPADIRRAIIERDELLRMLSVEGVQPRNSEDLEADAIVAALNASGGGFTPSYTRKAFALAELAEQIAATMHDVENHEAIELIELAKTPDILLPDLTVAHQRWMDVIAAKPDRLPCPPCVVAQPAAGEVEHLERVVGAFGVAVVDGVPLAAVWAEDVGVAI